MSIDKEELNHRLAVEMELNRIFREKAAMLLCDGDEQKFDSKDFWLSGGFIVEKWERALMGGWTPSSLARGRDCLFDNIEMVSVSHPDLDCYFSFEVCRLHKRGFLGRKKYMYRLCEFYDNSPNYNEARALDSYAYVSDKRLIKTFKMLYSIAKKNRYGEYTDPETKARWEFFSSYEESIEMMKRLNGHGKRQLPKITTPTIPDKPFSEKAKTEKGNERKRKNTRRA